jgi:hypothetical protein
MEAQLGSSTAANALAADGKLPQMRVLPSHGGLNDGMEFFERHRDRYLDFAPNRWIAVEQIDAQRGNYVRGDAILGAQCRQFGRLVLPVPRQQLAEAINRMPAGHAVDDVGEVSLRIKTVELVDG